MAHASDETPAVFTRLHDEFIPTTHALSPWGDDRLHGGPVLGLLARGVEAALGDAAFVPTRLTFDLFRAAPTAPLRVATEIVRKSRRLSLVVASLRAGETEVARVTAMSLMAGTVARHAQRFAKDPVMAGPEGLETGPLLRGSYAPRNIPRGFHTSVETRWAPHQLGEPLAIWFRIPFPLVAGEATSPLQRVAALSDFCNAVASFSGRASGHSSPPYINTDTTLYLSRAPRGEWIGLYEERMQEQDGISLTQTALFDGRGCFGRALQGRLANG